MGRIRRIGTDSVTNYSFQATSAYDADNPAATTGAWSDSDAMDQSLRQASPTEVTAEGCLVTFERFPDTFDGAKVKIQPTYDFDAGETPALELWTHDSETSEWTLRRSIDLTNPFVGALTGARKVFDLTFFPTLRTVDKVWITMNPGSTGTPSIDFAAIQLFGRCEASLPKGSGSGDGDLCDPNHPLYTGFDEAGNPCPGSGFGPPTDDDIPDLDLCNPASIAAYREAVATIPGFVEMFDAWFEQNRDNIAAYCAGSVDDPPTGQPTLPNPPALPPLDLCDDDSIEAFRAAVSGDPDQLQSFEDFLDGLEADGFFELVCPPPLPDEEYVNPNTLEPEEEPTEPTGPFGQGPGGVPEPGAARPDNSPPKHVSTGDGEPIEYFAFFFSGAAPDGTATPTGGTARSYITNHFEDEPTWVAEFAEAYAKARRAGQVFEETNAETKDGVQFTFSGAVAGTVVNVRAVKIGIGGNFLAPANCFVFVGPQTMDGDGFGNPGPGPGTLGPVDTSGGTFATENPIPGAAYYRFNRTGVGEVNVLKIACPNDDPVGGNAINRGNALMVRIIATAPGTNSAVTVEGDFY